MSREASIDRSAVQPSRSENGNTSQLRLYKHSPNSLLTVPVAKFTLESPTSESPSVSDAEDIYLTSVDKTHKNGDSVANIRKTLRYSMGTAIMMLSSSQILMSYVLEPQSIASSYRSFLITHGGIRDQQPNHARDYLETITHVLHAGIKGVSTKFERPEISVASAIPPPLESNIPSGIDASRLAPYMDHISQAPHEYIMCALQHPAHTSCELGALHSFKKEWLRAMQLYIPLNASQDYDGDLSRKLFAEEPFPELATIRNWNR
ncbi:hypothetical protein HDU83_007962 [Entophlyctis luteolus]|nr:hypothetical protein HDU83_007962 [Entophlyctis luteolus]KAJ3377462.1 hypothetical protein HDU84_008616 [Entophlyctis sp. JEL0112]